MDIFSIGTEISQNNIVYCIDELLAVINGESYELKKPQADCQLHKMISMMMTMIITIRINLK